MSDHGGAFVVSARSIQMKAISHRIFGGPLSIISRLAIILCAAKILLVSTLSKELMIRDACLQRAKLHNNTFGYNNPSMVRDYNGR